MLSCLAFVCCFVSSSFAQRWDLNQRDENTKIVFVPLKLSLVCYLVFKPDSVFCALVLTSCAVTLVLLSVFVISSLCILLCLRLVLSCVVVVISLLRLVLSCLAFLSVCL